MSSEHVSGYDGEPLEPPESIPDGLEVEGSEPAQKIVTQNGVTLPRVTFSRLDNAIADAMGVPRGTILRVQPAEEQESDFPLSANEVSGEFPGVPVSHIPPATEATEEDSDPMIDAWVPEEGGWGRVPTSQTYMDYNLGRTIFKGRPASSEGSPTSKESAVERIRDVNGVEIVIEQGDEITNGEETAPVVFEEGKEVAVQPTTNLPSEKYPGLTERQEAKVSALLRMLTVIYANTTHPDYRFNSFSWDGVVDGRPTTQSQHLYPSVIKAVERAAERMYRKYMEGNPDMSALVEEQVRPLLERLAKERDEAEKTRIAAEVAAAEKAAADEAARIKKEEQDRAAEMNRRALKVTDPQAIVRDVEEGLRIVVSKTAAAAEVLRAKDIERWEEEDRKEAEAAIKRAEEHEKAFTIFNSEWE